MNTDDLQKPCIEVKLDMGVVQAYSVRGYEATLQRARRLGSPAARDDEGIRWADGAPAVEKLTVSEQQPWLWGPRLRICDWTTYDAQMRELIGIA